MSLACEAPEYESSWDGVGALIVNVIALDVPPFGLGETAVTEAVPGVTIKVDGTIADALLLSKSKVWSGCPFQ
jgi:hypothetical protein